MTTVAYSRLGEDGAAVVNANDPKLIWQSALGRLQMQVTRPNYDTWLKNTQGVGCEDGEFVVIAPNAFVAEMLEQRLYSLVADAVEGVLGEPMEIRFTVEGAKTVEKEADAEHAGPATLTTAHPAPPNEHAKYHSLNTKYTFERFIVGKSNELAYAAANAVAEKPGELYNPLVMYSDVGLGKTHLMHAIGQKTASRGMTMVYSTTEEFTNAYIKAIREGTTDLFRDRYRSVDLLLLDDVQFLIGKEQTQEGFFHTFNALHMTNRQIVLTSDRPVTALTILEDRIQSRLAGGLVVDIQPPDIETRLAILKIKANGSRLPVSDEVIHYLAERIHKNIRELEGGLNKVIALADMLDTPATVELVNRAIADVVGTAAKRQISEATVIDTVATYLGVGVDKIKGRKRDKKTAQARQVAMYLLREESELGLTAIGRALGGKDHTTVKHGCDRIANQLNVDAHLRRDIINIREKLASL